MPQQGLSSDHRIQCEFACQMLTQAIDILDDHGLQIFANHAHLCLEKVREYLDGKNLPSLPLA